MKIELSSEELNKEDVKKIKEICEQNLLSCYQCGKCSAGCPAADVMDLLPHQVVRLAQLGLIDEILESKTIWICASCITCTASCPRGVDLAKIMEALRQVVLRKKTDYVNINEINQELLEKLPAIALVGNFRKLTI